MARRASPAWLPANAGAIWTAALVAAALLIPYAYAAVTGTAEDGLGGLAGWHSAAQSVYCANGMTPVIGILLVELGVVLALTLASQWRPALLGTFGATLRADGWLMLGTLVLAAIPFLIAWQTNTSPCTRGRAFFWESVFIDVFTLAILAISYNLMFGFAGVVSFGHAAFFGLGAYGVGVFMEHLDWPWWLAILAALALGIVVALIKGAVGLRIKGLYFALFTLAFAQVFYLLAGNRLLANVTGAEDGFTFSVPDWLNITQNRLFFYYMVLLALALAFGLVRRLMHSPTGRVLSALRDNESRAQMLGYNTFHFKLIAIVLAGILASGAGVLRGLAQKGASPEVLSLDFTMTPLLMTIIGGMGTFLGPVVGAFGLYLTEEALRDTVVTVAGRAINVGERWALILGVLFVVAVMVFPHGIVGTLRLWWGRWRASRSALAEPEAAKPLAVGPTAPQSSTDKH